MSSPGSAGSPLDRIEAVVAGWRDQGTWRAFREDWFPETLEALVNVAKAAEAICAEPTHSGPPHDQAVRVTSYRALREIFEPLLAVLSRPEGTDKEPT